MYAGRSLRGDRGNRPRFPRSIILVVLPVTTALAVVAFMATSGFAGASDLVSSAVQAAVKSGPPASGSGPSTSPPGPAKGELTASRRPVSPTTVPSSTTSTTIPTSTTTTTLPTAENTTPTTAPPTTSKSGASNTTPTTAPPSTTTTTPPPESLQSIPDNCSVDVSASLTAYLTALPSGAVFRPPAGACYQVDQGVVITHPMTITGGELEDDSSLSSVVGDGSGDFDPILKIYDTSDVTVSDMTIQGADTGGVYHPALVGEAGIKVVSSADVTLDDISVSDTFGDGLELVADLYHEANTPDTNLVVDGYTTNYTGRQGMTLAEVEGASFTDVHINHPDFDGFDFESDVANHGAGNISISDCTYGHGFNVIEPVYGPISVNDCSGSQGVSILDGPSDQPVSFSNGSLRCLVRSPLPCIHLGGGQLTFSHMTITRINSNEHVTEPVWAVSNDGHLSLIDTSVQDPFGVNDAGSTVTISQ